MTTVLWANNIIYGNSLMGYSVSIESSALFGDCGWVAIVKCVLPFPGIRVVVQQSD